MIIKENFDLINKQWNTSNFFISKSFIKCYTNNNKNLKHLFIKLNNSLIYAQFFNINLKKSSNYLNNSLLAKIIFNLFKIKTLYLTNSFFTNAKSYEIDSKINLDLFLKHVNNQINYFLLVIPDFLYENFEIHNNDFVKVEIEEEMLMNIDKKWKNTEDYKASLKAKYRKKIKTIEIKSKSIKTVEFSKQDIKMNKVKIQQLFNQVLEKSKFNGPRFNTSTLFDLQKNKICKLYGYFLKDDLIGFTSEIINKKQLFSYYVGFDKKLNKDYSIYGRMLLETIKNGISQKCNKIIFGRTANEYKSNFGATPKKSYIYLKTKTKFSNFFMSFIFKKLSKSKWTQRKPFKK